MHGFSNFTLPVYIVLIRPQNIYSEASDIGEFWKICPYKSIQLSFHCKFFKTKANINSHSSTEWNVTDRNIHETNCFWNSSPVALGFLCVVVWLVNIKFRYVIRFSLFRLDSRTPTRKDNTSFKKIFFLRQLVLAYLIMFMISKFFSFENCFFL